MIRSLTRENGLRTCPEYDLLFCSLAEKLLKCSEDRLTGCIGCRVFGWCNNVWDQLCQIGSQRYIREGELKGFELEFSRLRGHVVYADNRQ